jgi:hypothetical protein
MASIAGEQRHPPGGADVVYARPRALARLRRYPHMLHQYLHALFVKDARAGQQYHEMQVGLYAK